MGANIATELIYAFGHTEYDDIFDDSPRHMFDWCILIVPINPDADQFSQFSLRMEAYDEPRKKSKKY